MYLLQVPFITSPECHGPTLLAFHLQISVLPVVSDDAPAVSPSSTWPAPTRDPPPFPCMAEMFPSVPTHIISPSARSSFQMHPARARTLSSPAFLHFPTESAYAPALPPPQRIIVRQIPPIPLSFVLAYVPRSRLPVLARISKHFGAAAQLALYRTLELSADDVDACGRVAGWLAHHNRHVRDDACAVRLRARARPVLPLATITLLTLLTDTLPYARSDDFLTCTRRQPAVPLTLHITSTLYDGLCPVAQFGIVRGARKVLVLVHALDVDVLTRAYGISDKVSLLVPYKQVDSLLPNLQALRTLLSFFLGVFIAQMSLSFSSVHHP
ncbi:hypothetical protein EDB85DRAFT_2144759 [Lactarius pseudohatsudake]|nr:hypothetical protein EDB85DRAFT_2144759 [Lactarius pseudohatsudake]